MWGGWLARGGWACDGSGWQSSEFRVQGLGCWVKCLEKWSRGNVLGFRVEGLCVRGGVWMLDLTVRG